MDPKSLLEAPQFVVDSDAWPRIATTPQGLLVTLHSKRAEAEFAQACEDASLSLEGEDPDLVVYEEALFARIAVSGWLGVAESYMAGEWEAKDLCSVLTRLIAAGYNPKQRRPVPEGKYVGLELPPGLSRLLSDEGMSSPGTIFSSGVPTSERVAVKNYSAGAAKGREPSHYFVDVTMLSEPTLVERADLHDAQMRSLSRLMDLGNVHVGTHLVDYPSSGAALPIAAAVRGATVDVLSSDPEFLQDTQQVIEVATSGAGDSVQTQILDSAVPKPTAWMGDYDVVASVEKLENMGEQTRIAYVRALDQMLGASGSVILQTVIKTAKNDSLVQTALDVAKVYFWPAQDFLSLKSVTQLFDTQTSLRTVAETHIGSHYCEGLALQREVFIGHEREAAADGFDAVYRRLINYYLAMKEALLRTGMIDVAQLKLVHRRRNIRRQDS